jgi:DMSO reductase anchor subunit
MRPALSVILFTVLSGAGLGLFALLVLLQLAGPRMSDAMHLTGGLLALALVAAGLISSTFHLANPRNAWRALARVRSSWLSREGVLALAFFPVALGYLYAAHASPGAWASALGLAAVALGWATLFSTAMIYACLRTIPRWHNRLVPAAYFANGHLSGALILLALALADGAATRVHVGVALAALTLAAAIKWAYYRRFDVPNPRPHTLAAALGMTAAQARLLDAGHTHGTFLTHEFMFQVGRERARLLRAGFFALSVAAPLAILALDPGSAWLAAAAALACLLGLLVERWLFFAEAQHVVRLFHGQQAV